MSRYVKLVLADARNVRRDPMLVMALSGPLLIAVFFRFAPPVVGSWLDREFAFDLTAYHELILGVILQLIPLLLGMITGYLMLDERDEQLIQLFAVTPLRKSGYLAVRLAAPALLTAVFSLFGAVVTGLVPLAWNRLIPAIVLLSMEGPMLALFLAAYAANKVEGLALSKGAGVLIAAPLAVWFLPAPGQYAVAVLPMFWTAKVLFAGGPSSVIPVFLTALAVHAAFLAWLYRAFLHRVD